MLETIKEVVICSILFTVILLIIFAIIALYKYIYALITKNKRAKLEYQALQRKILDLKIEYEKSKNKYEKEKENYQTYYQRYTNTRLDNYYQQKKKEIDENYQKEIERLKLEQQQLECECKKWSNISDTYKKATYCFFDKIYSESKVDLKFYSTLIADYHKKINEETENYLRHKERPAVRAADTVKEISSRLHNIEKQYKLLSYQMELYENLFPWITEYKEISFDDINEITQTSAEAESEKQYLREYLSPDEYEKLPTVEKYQLALERYKKRKKSNWQIGIAYERYIGYLYERKGYKVEYYGAKKGLEDLGRDLIAKKGNKILIIQCKYWNKEKTIHEKHIFQLYGTMFAFSLMNEYKDYEIKGIFITSASLSDLAKIYAEKLNIQFQELVDFDKEYPCIKCNIGKEGKIYHLPFDQQYDNVVIDYKKGECYIETVAEAESLGFRRAHKWIETYK